MAVRGKLIAQISATQIDQAVALRPDLVTISAGGNDVIRPGSDPDQVSQQFEDMIVRLSATGATVVASIWGRGVDDYRRAAEQLAAAPAGVVAVEVNLSCPNLEGRRGIFAHDADLSAEVIRVTSAAGRPRWAKLSPNTDRVVEVATAVRDAGAEAVTLVNTLLGMVLDPATGRPALAAGGGGYSGRGIHPVAVRAVFDTHVAHPDLPIIGVGGVASGWDAAEFMLAGASAVSSVSATSRTVESTKRRPGSVRSTRRACWISRLRGTSAEEMAS